MSRLGSSDSRRGPSTSLLGRLKGTAFWLALGVVLGASSPGFAQTLNLNPGPANNGGSTGWAIFFDATSVGPISITQMTTASTAAAGATFTVEIFRRVGTALGGPVGSGAGSSTAGWTSLGMATATQGPTANGVSLPIDIPDIALVGGQLTGIAVQFTGAGPRYFGTGTPPYGTYSDANLTIVTGDARSVPFTPTGTWFASRELVGAITYVPVPVDLMGFEVQ